MRVIKGESKQLPTNNLYTMHTNHGKVALKILEQYFAITLTKLHFYSIDLDLLQAYNNSDTSLVQVQIAKYCSGIHKVIFPQLVRIASLSLVRVRDTDCWEFQITKPAHNYFLVCMYSYTTVVSLQQRHFYYCMGIQQDCLLKLWYSRDVCIGV